MVPEGQGPCCTRRDGSRKDGSGMNRSVLAREVDGAVNEGWAGVSRPGPDRGCGAAARPRPPVRFLRGAVPVVVAATVIAVSLATWFSPTRLLARLPTGGS